MNETYGCVTTEGNAVSLTRVHLDGWILGRGGKFVLTQSFKNMEQKPLEIVYRFPLPESAAPCGFEAHVHDRRIKGFVEERDRAFEMYDKALEQGDGAYLLDQERPNIFTLSLGNLNPEQEAHVVLEYVLLLDATRGGIRLDVPTTISPRYVPASMPDRRGIPETDRIHPPYAENVPWGLSMSLYIERGRDLKAISSPSHPVRLDFDGDAAIVSLSRETVAMDRDFILQMEPKRETLEQAYYVRENGRGLMQLDFCSGLKPDTGPAFEEKSPSFRELIFVLDCSGSMAGDSISSARKALEILLRAMTRNRPFNLYRFGSHFESLLESPKPFDEKTLALGLAFLRGAEADLGGTEMAAPLADIFRTQSPASGRDILLLTDGEVANEEALFKQVQSAGTATRLFAVGIGSAPNAYLVKGLARAGRGAWTFVHPGGKIEPGVLALFGQMNGPVVEGASISWGVPGDVTQAPADTAVFENHPATFFAEFSAEGPVPEAVTVTARLAGVPILKTVPVKRLQSRALPPQILWARERIRDLSDESGSGRHGGSDPVERKRDTRRKTVVDLSRSFQILSPYTSFVAVEERAAAEKTTEDSELRRIPVPVAVGWHGMGGFFGGKVYRASPSGTGLAGPAALSVSDALDVPAYCRKSMVVSEPPPPRRRKSKKRLSAPRKQGVLMEILLNQNLDGGIILSRDLSKTLGLDPEAMKKAAQGMKTRQPVDHFLLLSTALLLHILENHMSDLESQWRSVVDKSRAWLEEMLQEADPMVAGKPLMTWVTETVKTTPFVGVRAGESFLGKLLRRGVEFDG